MADVSAQKIFARYLRKQGKKIGAQDEAMIWGFKAEPEFQAQVVDIFASTKDDIKGHSGARVVLESQPKLAKTMTGKTEAKEIAKLGRNGLVFIPNADHWQQPALVSVALQAAHQGGRAIIGFSDESRLCMSIYHWLVTYECDGENLER